MSKKASKGKFYGAWSAFLNTLMEKRRLKPKQFATLLKEKHNNISQYLSGIIRPPITKLSAWSERLDLTSAEKDEFIRLAELEYTPKNIRDELDRLASDLTKVKGVARNALRRLGVNPSEHGL